MIAKGLRSIGRALRRRGRHASLAADAAGGFAPLGRGGAGTGSATGPTGSSAGTLRIRGDYHRGRPRLLLINSPIRQVRARARRRSGVVLAASGVGRSVRAPGNWAERHGWSQQHTARRFLGLGLERPNLRHATTTNVAPPDRRSRHGDLAVLARRLAAVLQTAPRLSQRWRAARSGFWGSRVRNLDNTPSEALHGPDGVSGRDSSSSGRRPLGPDDEVEYRNSALARTVRYQRPRSERRGAARVG